MNYYKITETNGVNIRPFKLNQIISETEIMQIDCYYFLHIELINPNK